MQRFQGINGETLPSKNTPDLLRIEHVLQRYRDVWVPIETHPFLAVDLERVSAHCAKWTSFLCSPTVVSCRTSVGTKVVVVSSRC
jgi:hypothetical protein